MTNILGYVNDPVHKRYVDEISKFINEKHEILTQLKNEIASAFPSRIFKNDVYNLEGHILYQEFLLKDKKRIVVDTYFSDEKRWQIEVFIREIEDKDLTEKRLKEFPCFLNIDFEKRKNQRLIYAEHPEESLKEVADSLENLIRCILIAVDAAN